MEKHFKILLLTACILPLISCGNENVSESIISKKNSEIIISEDIKSEIPSEIFSNTEETSSNEDDEYILDDSMFAKTSIDIGINDAYGLRYIINDEYVDSWLEIYTEDASIAYPNENDQIVGSSVGTLKLKVVADETYYDELTINVLPDDEFNTTFKIEKARMQGKSMIVLGDSISDNSESAYTNKQYFWCEQLADMFDMTLYDYAISGSTTGYCEGLVSRDDSFKYIVGTHVVNKKEVQVDIAKSDYAFIYFGNNDCTYKSEIGQIGDVNNYNYLEKESFKGSYSYIISKLREVNPNIKIICLSLSYSTWGPNDSTRSNFADIVGDIADECETKYVYIYDLWNSSTFSTYCPDGIHPYTAGYELIVNRILES